MNNPLARKLFQIFYAKQKIDDEEDQNNKRMSTSLLGLFFHLIFRFIRFRCVCSCRCNCIYNKFAVDWWEKPYCTLLTALIHNYYLNEKLLSNRIWFEIDYTLKITNLRDNLQLAQKNMSINDNFVIKEPSILSS